MQPKTFTFITDPIANVGGRVKLDVAAAMFFVLKFLIKAIGDAARHPPLLESSNRVLILDRD